MPKTSTPRKKKAAPSVEQAEPSRGSKLLRGVKDLATQAVQLPGSTAKVAAAFVPLTRLLGGLLLGLVGHGIAPGVDVEIETRGGALGSPDDFAGT